jgi:hypothetical protein
MMNCAMVGLIALTMSFFIQSDAEQVVKVIDDDFNVLSADWKEISIEGSGDVKKTINNSALEITASEASSSVGLYNSKPVTGNFYVEAEFAEDDALQLVLFASKEGKPDLKNYTSMAITKREGIVCVNHYDKQNGVANVHDPRKKIPASRYQIKLDKKTFSVPYSETNKKIRILHENCSNTFHFYYGTRLEKWEIVTNDWMEIAPQYSWLPNEQEYLVGLICRNEGTTGEKKVSFKSIKGYQIPNEDLDDSKTGFKVAEREYYWSGHFGKATVVTFGEEFPFDKNIKFVFWDMANNAPAWRLTNQFMLNYEFFEGGDSQYDGCHEAMSDRQRHGQKLEIIEDNNVRKIIRWHGIPVNPQYNYSGEGGGGKDIPYYDEYWTFYPDGTGTRRFIDTPKLDITHRRNWGPEFIEVMPLGGTAVEAGDLCASPALTLFDLDKTQKSFLPHTGGFDRTVWSNLNQLIISSHFKDSMPDFFLAVSQSNDIPETWPGLKIEAQLDWHKTTYNFSHWPVGREPYGQNTDQWGASSRSYASYANEVTHTSLISVGMYQKYTDFATNFQVDSITKRKYREWVMLIGTAPANDTKKVREQVGTWLYPGAIKSSDENSAYVGINYDLRELVFKNTKKNGICNFTLTPDKFPVHNPAIRIENWMEDPRVSVMVNGQEVKFRSAIVKGAMLVWINTTITEQAKIAIYFDANRSPVITNVKINKKVLKLNNTIGGFSCTCPYISDWIVSVFNMQGKMLLNQKMVGKNSFIIPTGSINQGKYIVKITNGKEMLQKMVVNF